VRPMSEFDPESAVVVHDRFHDIAFVWRTGWAHAWRLSAWVASDGLAYWDGLILDGWEPLSSRR
jgi:hypothetical protein